MVIDKPEKQQHKKETFLTQKCLKIYLKQMQSTNSCLFYTFKIRFFYFMGYFSF